MTKKEYFTSIVNTLSTRATNIIEKFNITPDNICSYHATYFSRIRNCGKKTQQELLFLYKCMSNYSQKDANSADPSLDEKDSFENQIASFNLSCRGRTVLANLDVHDFASLQKEASKDFVTLYSMKNIGKKTIMEIRDFYDYLCKILPQVENEVPELNPEYKAYMELQSSYLNKLLSEIYLKAYNNLSSHDQKIISLNCANFVELLSANVTTINIAASNQERRDVIADIIFAFRDKFLLEASLYLEMSREDLWWHEYFSDKNYLSPESKMFIRQFKEKENHIPFWYVLNQMIFHLPHTGENRIFLWYLGLSCEIKSYQKLCREICSNIDIGSVRTNIRRVSSSIIGSSWKEQELLMMYPFLRNDFLTVENTHFNELSAQEHLQFDFHAFCYFCTLLISKFETIDFYSNNGKIVTSNYNGEHIYTLTYNNDLFSFNLALMMQQVKRSINKYTGNDIVISNLCKNSDLWKNNEIKQDLIARIVPLAEHLISVLYQIECKDGLICVKNIRYNSDSVNSIKQVLYNCLAASNKPLSLVELFEVYRKECPDSAFTMPKQLRSVINQLDQIVAIGGKSLYTLKEKLAPQAFQGSLYDCIERVLIDSGKPMKKGDVITAALKIRPDSTSKSIRSIISSMLRSDRLKLYNNEYLGLTGKKYGRSFKITNPEPLLTFEERMMQLYDFVAANGRLPFASGSSEEASLALWYYRAQHNTSLTTQQMVHLYEFRQAAKEAKIPLTAEHDIFRKNCFEYKAIVMSTGQIPRINENKRLVNWLQQSCKRYSELDDIYKYYFDQLVSFLSDFGYNLDIK